jgi:hypothetical protein
LSKAASTPRTRTTGVVEWEAFAGRRPPYVFWLPLSSSTVSRITYVPTGVSAFGRHQIRW